jgi:hypothetical protein
MKMKLSRSVSRQTQPKVKKMTNLGLQSSMTSLIRKSALVATVPLILLSTASAQIRAGSNGEVSVTSGGGNFSPMVSPLVGIMSENPFYTYTNEDFRIYSWTPNEYTGCSYPTSPISNVTSTHIDVSMSYGWEIIKNGQVIASYIPDIAAVFGSIYQFGFPSWGVTTYAINGYNTNGNIYNNDNRNGWGVRMRQKGCDIGNTFVIMPPQNATVGNYSIRYFNYDVQTPSPNYYNGSTYSSQAVKGAGRTFTVLSSISSTESIPTNLAVTHYRRDGRVIVNASWNSSTFSKVFRLKSRNSNTSPYQTYNYAYMKHPIYNYWGPSEGPLFSNYDDDVFLYSDAAGSTYFKNKQGSGYPGDKNDIVGRTFVEMSENRTYNPLQLSVTAVNSLGESASASSVTVAPSSANFLPRNAVRSFNGDIPSSGLWIDTPSSYYIDPSIYQSAYINGRYSLVAYKWEIRDRENNIVATGNANPNQISAGQWGVRWVKGTVQVPDYQIINCQLVLVGYKYVNGYSISVSSPANANINPYYRVSITKKVWYPYGGYYGQTQWIPDLQNIEDAATEFDIVQ